MAFSTTDILPPSFLTGPGPEITAKDINFSKTALHEYRDYYAVVLDNVLTAEECQLLVQAAEATSNGTWEPAAINVGGGKQQVSLGERNCGRIMWDSPELVAKIWARIEEQLPELRSLERRPHVTGSGPAMRGETWRMTQLNERMRFLKYGAGQYFRGVPSPNRPCSGPTDHVRAL